MELTRATSITLDHYGKLSKNIIFRTEKKAVEAYRKNIIYMKFKNIQKKMAGGREIQTLCIEDEFLVLAVSFKLVFQHFLEISTLLVPSICYNRDFCRIQ